MDQLLCNGISLKTFDKMTYLTYQKLRYWAKRRHPKLADETDCQRILASGKRSVGFRTPEGTPIIRNIGEPTSSDMRKSKG